MGERLHHQKPFLKAVLSEANQHRHNHLLRTATADQINAVSELVLNTLKGVVPKSRDTVRCSDPTRIPYVAWVRDAVLLKTDVLSWWISLEKPCGVNWTAVSNVVAQHQWSCECTCGIALQVFSHETRGQILFDGGYEFGQSRQLDSKTKGDFERAFYTRG